MATATKTPKPTARRKANIPETVKAKVWHALKFLAGKETGKAARDVLADGEASEMSVRVEAVVGGREYSEQIVGQLQVGRDETTSRSALDEAGLVANFLALVPKTRHATIEEDWPAHVTEHNGLPEVTDEERNRAEQLLKRLRSRTESPRRGSVRFQRTAKA